MSASRNRKYPEYKDSGRQWLKEIPSHWSTPKFGQVFRERRTKVSDKDFDALSVTKEGIVPQLATAAKTDHGDNRKLVLNGDFVINSRSDRKGSSGVSRLNGSVSTISIVLEILKGNNRYIHHLLRSHDFKEEFYRLGHGIVADLWSTRFDDIKGELLCFPPENEQEHISDFLDFADKTIIGLVKSLEQLLEMLEEKRSALITQAVIKGLNPNVLMKDSGNEWLGKIPEHWKLVKIKHVCEVFGRIGFRGYTTEDIVEPGKGAITLSPSNIVNGVMNYSDPTYLSWEKYLESPEIMLEYQDVLMVKTGSTFGRIGFVDHLIEKTTLNPQLVVFKKLIISKEYFYYLMSSNYIKALTDVCNTGSTIPTMSQENISNFTIPVPPEQEIYSILKTVRIQTEKVAHIREKLEQEKERLKEYRTALISAAVTGKIDVRGQA